MSSDARRLEQVERVIVRPHLELRPIAPDLSVTFRLGIRLGLRLLIDVQMVLSNVS
jgi:hypothetical protein